MKKIVYFLFPSIKKEYEDIVQQLNAVANTLVSTEKKLEAYKALVERCNVEPQSEKFMALFKEGLKSL